MNIVRELAFVEKSSTENKISFVVSNTEEGKIMKVDAIYSITTPAGIKFDVHESTFTPEEQTVICSGIDNMLLCIDLGTEDIYGALAPLL